MKDKTNGSDLTAAQQKLTAAQTQKAAAIKNQSSAQVQQSSAQSLFDNTEQYTKKEKQITTTDETGKTIVQTVFEQIINPAWASALEALNAANSELSAANEELSAAEEEVNIAENDLSEAEEAEEAEEETKETEENTEQTTLLSSKTAQTAENMSYTEASSSLNEDTEGNLGQNPDLAIIQENSDGTRNYLGVEGLKQNEDGSWTDKNGNRVEIESTYQNAGFETDGIVTLTLYEGDKTTKKSYNTAYNVYSEEIYDKNNNCTQRSSVSYNDKGEIINETKQTPIDGDNWMVESTNGNYVYNEKYDLCYATDENNNKCDEYYYSTVDLAIQAGNTVKNGGTPLTQSEIQEYVINIHNAKNKDALTEILNNENLTSDNLISIVTAYNNKYAGIESSDNKSRIAYNNKYGLTESFFNDKPQNSFINHLDKVLSGKNKENVMKLITEKMISSSENGNSYATDMLAREIYNSTAGKTGTSDEFVMNIVNDNTNPKVLSDVMERYSVVNNGRNIIKDIENDFNPLLDSSIFDNAALKKTLNNAFKANHDGMSYEEYLKSAQSANNKPSYIGTSNENSQTQDTNTNKPQDLTQDPNVEFWPKAYKVGDKTCYKVAGVDGLMLNGFSIADHDIYGNKIQTENAIEYYMGKSNNCTIWIQDETTGKTTKVTYDKSTRTRTEEIYDSEKYYKQSFVQYDETGKVIDWSNESVKPMQSADKATTNTETRSNCAAPVTNKKDGKIDATNQHGTGDCWLLSGINALSYTEEGTKAIKEALEYDNEGNATVHLKGVGDYSVTKEEINAIRKEQENGSIEYSTGDDDMLVMELAIEKVYTDVLKGNIMFATDAPGEFEKYRTNITDGNGAIYGGQMTQLMYIITGKKTEHINDKNDMEKALNEFDGKNVALGASISELQTKVTGNEDWLRKEGSESEEGVARYYLKDINGKEHRIGAPHAYAIKNVSDNTVTVTNPWDSSDEIVIKKEQYIALFDTISKCDLKGENVNLIRYPDEIVNGEKYYYFDNLTKNGFGDGFGSMIDSEKFAHFVQIYKEDGTFEIAQLDENGNKLHSEIKVLDENGKQYDKEESVFYRDGKYSITIIRDKDGNKTYEFRQSNDAEQTEQTIQTSESTAENMHDRGILKYKQFNLEQANLLANLSDNDWAIAEKCLEDNSDANYNEIMEEIKKSKN